MLISGVRCICANIWGWIRYVASAIATELLKFALVLLMAYFIAYGIFELWAQIIPDIPSTQRLSAAAAALVSRAARVSGATQTEYPFVVEPPTRTSVTRNSDATAPSAPPATPPKPATRASTESADAPTMSKRKTGSYALASAPTATPTEVLAEAEAAVEAAAVAAAAAAVAVAEASEVVDEQQRNAGADKD